VVNTASRVQDATKEYRAPLLVTDPIRVLVEQEFEFGRCFTCQLRGKEGAHILYEVLGEAIRKRRAVRSASSARTPPAS